MIKVYIPNLKKRTDRYNHIQNEYAGKSEFDVEIFVPPYNDYPHLSLWQAFVSCVRKEQEKGSDYFIFCEDDHTFKNYSYDKLMKDIDTCIKDDVDLLSGGVFGCNIGDTILPTACTKINDGLVSVDHFAGTQFIVIFNRAYDKILKEQEGGVLDSWLAKVLSKKYVMFPFISNQMNGTSDITFYGYVDMKNMFCKAEQRVSNVINNVCE